MKRNEIRNSVPQTPAHFVRAMDETLERIESMNIHRKTAKRPTRTLLIAALIAVLLAGTAVAVGQAFGIFEMMTLKPLDGAEEIIQTNVGQFDGTHGGITIEEAAYSGNTYSLLIRVTAGEDCDIGLPELSIQNAEYEDMGFFGTQIREDEAGTTYLMSGIVLDDIPEILEGEIISRIYRNGDMLETLTAPFQLLNTEAASAQLIPLNEGKQWQFVSASLSLGELFAVFEVRYICDVAQDEMGVDIILFDADGNRLESASGTGFDEEDEDGTIVHGWRTEYQSFDTLPEKLILKPKIIGEDAWLDPIECAVIPK